MGTRSNGEKAEEKENVPGPGPPSLNDSALFPCASSKNRTVGMPPRDVQDWPAKEDVPACRESWEQSYEHLILY